jgi:hypothetical protein
MEKQMLTFRKTATLAGTLLLLGAGACADLEVTNPNEPDAGRALTSAGDVEALIAGSFASWYVGQHSYDGPELALTRMAFEATAPWNNAGMVPLSRIPREPLVNNPAGTYYLNQSWTWTYSYRALAAVGSGLKAIEEDPEIQAGLDESGGLLRARVFGKFMQGLGHAAVAFLYDQGFVIDETTDITGVEPVPYNELMTAAMGYFDEALALAATGDFTLPANWMSSAVTRDQLIGIIHGYKARYMATVARNPQERAAVNWPAVIAETNAAIGDWQVDLTYAANNWEPTGQLAPGYALTETWNQLNYFVSGMADQSGRYQQWLAAPVNSRHPLLNGTTSIFIVTPDTRFAQGSTLEEQAANPGTLWVRHVPGQNWARPERGTWRWSYYRNILGDTVAYTMGGDSDWWLELDKDEMRLLRAEGLYRANNLQGAADLINVTRHAHGLNATNGAGLNTSCVPKLPNNACGDLFEMLKWEMRMESYAVGPNGAPWYAHGRGWGDLYEGTPIHFPVPAGELQVLGMPVYTFGGVGGEGSAPQSHYNYPGE